MSNPVEKTMRPRAVLLRAASAVLICLGLGGPALAADAYTGVETVPITLDGSASSRPVRIGINKSIAIELPVDVKDVVVSGPKVADAVMRTSRKAILIGVEVGNTNVFFFDTAGRQILALDVSVEHDISALQGMLRRLMPGTDIRAEGVKDNVVLYGDVNNAADARKAAEIAGMFVRGTNDQKEGKSDRVVSMLTIKGGDQVMLKVTVAEVQRNALKQLGVNTAAQFSVGGTTFRPVTNTGGDESNFGRSATVGSNCGPTQQLLGAVSGSLIGSAGCSFLDVTVKALETQGQLRMLAEPTLTAISGESADFLAGGEFPIPVDSGDNRVTVAYKKYGVALAFTPVVLSEGRISLKVQTEVSELSSEGAVTIGQILVRGVNVRRANTTIELPSGGSMTIAGLMQESTRQNVEGVPGLMQLPILGSMFRSRDYRRGQSELVIIVTPFIAAHVSRNELSRPDDGMVTASDPEAIFLNRLNQVYGAGGGRPTGAYRGTYGFILD